MTLHLLPHYQNVPAMKTRSKSRPRSPEISPALVLRAQNLVSAEILSEKLLHPPRSVGTGVDEMPHAAVQEGSINIPISTGEMERTAEKRSIGERSFNVFHDNDDGMDVSGTDILPKELTGPSQIGQWNIPHAEKHTLSSSASQPEEAPERPETTQTYKLQTLNLLPRLNLMKHLMKHSMHTMQAES